MQKQRERLSEGAKEYAFQIQKYLKVREKEMLRILFFCPSNLKLQFHYKIDQDFLQQLDRKCLVMQKPLPEVIKEAFKTRC